MPRSCGRSRLRSEPNRFLVLDAAPRPESPETIRLIMKDGVIYKKIAGETDWDATENEELIRRLLATD